MYWFSMLFHLWNSIRYAEIIKDAGIHVTTRKSSTKRPIDSSLDYRDQLALYTRLYAFVVEW